MIRAWEWLAVFALAIVAVTQGWQAGCLIVVGASSALLAARGRGA